MSEQISQNQIKELRKKFSNDNHIKVVRNAMIKTNSNELSMDWENIVKLIIHFLMLYQEKCLQLIKNQVEDVGDLLDSIFLEFI